MAPKTWKDRFKKRFLARYIYWIEAIGFVFIGGLIAGMIGSAVYKIDDVMKFTNVPATARQEPVAVPSEAYVDSVAVGEGDSVEKGQTLLVVTTGAEDLALLKALGSTQKALENLRGRPEGSRVPPGVEESLKEALSRGEAAVRQEPPQPILAPVGGIVTADTKAPWKTLAGTIVSHTIGSIYTYDSLRFSVPVGGDNALRVRVNLLAEPDVLDWKRLTESLKSERAPEDPVVRRLWGLLQGKLEEIKPGKVPLKRTMPEIVGALNEVLRKRDFYDPAAWSGKDLAPEARQLVGEGLETLTTDQVIRLNRLLLQAALPGAIAVSGNEHQRVKAKLYIPVESRTPEGKIVKEKPKIYPVEGEVVHEPEGGRVVIDLPAPPADVVDYMKRQRETPDLPPVTTSGSVVVGRITLFRFLFK